MATGKEYKEYILEQLSNIDGISCRSMMGEYIIYIGGKIAAYLCDNRFLVKDMPCTTSMLKEAKKEIPYEGAKEMLLVENTDDRAFLKELLETVNEHLPPPKPREKK
ncbi:MAG: TfoX/Sxy family protein [Clostridia bacterium]|nr:TfoX/Sxy family protein [Clostridia bacterium]